MTASVDHERAYYFQDLSWRVINQAARLCQTARDGLASGKAPHNPCGDDLDPGDLARIEAVFAGKCEGLSAWQEAQIRELAFWRSVAFDGYDGKDPVIFPLFQEHLMVSTFYRAGWAMAEFREAAIVELGCGPLGMIEYLPGARRVAFDSLNDKYGRLFGNFRHRTIDYVSDPRQLLDETASFDLAICHNVLDHTDDPAGWFDALFGKLKSGGRFIFQVNLSKPGSPQPAEHRAMHPSPLGFDQVMGWLAAKSERFDHFCETEPNGDNEFYFLSWGTKTGDAPVAYRQPPIAKTPARSDQTDAPLLPGAATEPVPRPGASTQPLTTRFTSAWRRRANLPGVRMLRQLIPDMAKPAAGRADEQPATGQACSTGTAADIEYANWLRSEFERLRKRSYNRIFASATLADYDFVFGPWASQGRFFSIDTLNLLKTELFTLPWDSHLTLLDVGSGCGAGIDLLSSFSSEPFAGYRIDCEALERDPRWAELYRIMYRNVPVRTESLSEIPDASYDIVTASHVIEHIAREEVAAFIRKLVSVARKFTIITCPWNEPAPRHPDHAFSVDYDLIKEVEPSSFTLFRSLGWNNGVADAALLQCVGMVFRHKII